MCVPRKKKGVAMKAVQMSPREHKLLNCLICLPQKLLSHHTRDNVSAFVLHDLCRSDCFNLHKAAYFVDNPDFDHFRGIAGISQNEVTIADDIWQAPETFNQKISSSPFNNHVRAIAHASVKKGSTEESSLLLNLAKQLAINNPQYYIWDLKHDNHGVLLFEESPDQKELACHFEKGVCLLGFCPIQ
jgi:hypothetical protein